MDGAKVRDLYLTAEAWQTSASRVAYRFFRSLGASPSGEAGSADLGGSSKYLSENLKD